MFGRMIIRDSIFFWCFLAARPGLEAVGLLDTEG